MLITRECDYAVRVLRAMAEEKRVSVNEICEKELITAPFAYKILKKLDLAGLVQIKRGSGGGCSLARDLADMTLYDVIRATDEEFFLTHWPPGGFRPANTWPNPPAPSTGSWPGSRVSWNRSCGPAPWRSCWECRSGSGPDRDRTDPCGPAHAALPSTA